VPLVAREHNDTGKGATPWAGLGAAFSAGLGVIVPGVGVAVV
jgi:hypothetical protein